MDLIVKNLTKSFLRSNSVVFKLEINSLSFSMGQIYYIMGHNGSGKTVLFKLLSSELSPDKGSVSFIVNEKSSSIIRPKIVRQQVEQNLALDLTVAENIYLHYKYINKKISKIFPHLFFNLNTFTEKYSDIDFIRLWDTPCSNLSLGQKQKLSFFLATMNESPMLLLDEFLASTDISTTKLLLKQMNYFSKSNPAIVIVISHNILEALENADKIFILKNGTLNSIIQKSSPEWTLESVSSLISLN